MLDPNEQGFLESSRKPLFADPGTSYGLAAPGPKVTKTTGLVDPQQATESFEWQDPAQKQGLRAESFSHNDSDSPTQPGQDPIIGTTPTQSPKEPLNAKKDPLTGLPAQLEVASADRKLGSQPQGSTQADTAPERLDQSTANPWASEGTPTGEEETEPVTEAEISVGDDGKNGTTTALPFANEGDVLPIETRGVAPSLQSSGQGSLPDGPQGGSIEESENKGVFQVESNEGEAISLRFAWAFREAGFENEIGIVEVDGEGNVGGVSPTDPGYTRAVLNDPSQRTIFGSGSDTGSWSEQTLPSGTSFATYLIQNGSRQQWLDADQDGASASDRPTVFLSLPTANGDGFDHFRSNALGDSVLELQAEDITGGGDQDFNDVVFQVSAEGLLAPGLVGQEAGLEVNYTGGEAGYKSELGMYYADDAYGRVGNLLPGDPGYAQAALSQNRSQVIFSRDEMQGETREATVESGKFIAWYLIADASSDTWRASNPTNDLDKGPIAWFSHPGANPDGLNHILYRTSNELAWEDLPGGGDTDYNDLVFSYVLTPPPQNLPPMLRLEEQLKSISEAADTSERIKVATLAVEDDGLGTNTLALTGTDATSFELVGRELFLKAGVALDTESKPEFSVAVEVDDETVGFSPDDRVEIVLGVDNVNESPRIDNQVFSVDENSAAGTVIGRIAASDPDQGDQLTFLIKEGNVDGVFALNPTSGELSVANPLALDFESLPTVPLTVEVSDGELSDGATVTVNLNDLPEGILLREEDFFQVVSQEAITIPEGPSVLSFTYSDLSFDPTDTDAINDALEAALVDQQGNSLVHTIAGNRDAFFNITEGEDPLLAAGASQDGTTVTLNLAGLPAGTAATLLIRLVNNDSDESSQIRITDIRVESADVTAPGGVTPVPAALRAQALASIDFATLSDLTSSFRTEYGRTSFNDDSRTLFTEVSINNAGTYAVADPLLVAVDVKDPEVRVVDPDGITPEGLPYYDFSALAATPILQPGEATSARTFQFYNPGGNQFNYELNVLGQLNRNPLFISAPRVDVVAGQQYRYQAEAKDADNDTLSYALTMAPEGMAIDPQTGVLNWSTEGVEPGAASVVIVVEDGRGGIDRQNFDVAVRGDIPNRPPSFVSVPVVQGNVGLAYSYTIEAVDPDGDVLTYEISEGPEGLILGEEGRLSWEPAGTQLGKNPVTVVARDGRGGEAIQTFQIQVLADPENLAPLITSKPTTSINLDTSPGEPTKIDFTAWTPVDYEFNFQPEAQWVIEEGTDNTVVRQIVNSDASILLSDFDASGEIIRGTWKVDATSDDDFMGFVFGYQDPQNYYLFDWKGNSQRLFGFAEGGMSIKKVQADSPLERTDLWPTAGIEGRVESLFHNTLRWERSVDYDFTLEYVPGQFTISVAEDDTVLESVTIDDDTFVNGRFGFYNYSQDNVLYSGFTRQSTAGGRYAYDVDAVDPDADPLSYSLIEGPRGMSIDTTTGALSWFATEDNLGQQAVTVAVEDGRGGIDTQSYLLEVNNTLPGEIRGQVREEVILDSDAVKATVPGPSNPWLAGLPDGTSGGAGDGAPAQSPVLVEGLNLEKVSSLLFTATGAVNFGPPLPGPDDTADGETGTIAHAGGALNGIGNIIAPANGLIGVFLGDELPTASPAPTTTLDFSLSGNVPGGIDYTNLAPELKQPFFIGDGFAGNASRQEVFVPAGASRLFLGTMDGFGWFNNSGQIEVLVTPVAPRRNLITNGDFSLGDFGFEADRAEVFAFDVGIDPRAFNRAASSYGDHTSGDGNMLIVNGSNTQPTMVWEQTIPVQEDSLYDFSLWTSTWFATNPGNFQVLVNDELIDTFQAPEDTAVWENFTTQWNADPGIVEATISIVNQQIAFTGNDFAFDDLFFGARAAGDQFEGITVFLDSNNNTILDGNEQSQQTDASGRYRFGGLTPGDYVVRQVPPRGFEQIEPGEAGPNPVSLEAGEVEIGVDFVIRPIDDPTNTDPTLLAPLPSGSIEIGERFTAQILAKDGDGDPLTYDLPLAPEGMVIDAETGVIAWVPNAEQTGDNVVITRVRDDFGGVVLQRFSLDVLLPNTDPVIVSSPPQLAAVGVPLVYGVLAQDSEEDELTYSLLNAPDGATISPLGQLEWTPLAGQEGLQSFSIEVGDGRGGSATQAFEVETRSTLPNQAPQITSTPRTALRVGDRYLYQVEANDPDFEALSYALNTAPTGMTISERGLVEWDSEGSALGSNPLALVVTDSRGETAEQAFNLEVLSTLTNRAPVFTSTPPQIAIAGQTFRYQPEVSDPDGDPVVFFPSGLFGQPLPAGASNNPATGEIRWTPGFEDLGSTSFAITTSDPYGGVASQVFEVEVVAGNRPPLISSTPITEAAVGDAYAYTIEAEDPDGGPLTFSLSRGPRNMVLEGSVLRWSPNATDQGEQQVTVEAIDALGAATTQSFTLLVTDSLPNRAPVITSLPGFTAEPDKPYIYQVQATDPEGEALTFVLEEAPDGVSLDPTTGLLEWTPTPAQAGLATISLKAQDPQGLGLIQTYSLAVAINNPPVISSTPQLQVTAGADYSYDLLASDPDGGSLAYQLLEAPDGMTIDDVGRLRWPTSSAVVGRAPVRVEVADNRGATAEQAFELEVVADTQAPSISILQNKTVVEPGEAVTFQVRASDDVGVETISFSVGGRAIGLDANGQANVVLNDLGPVLATAIATDAAGNTGSAEATAQAIDSSDVDAPVVSITSINDGDVITSPIDVIGSVTDDNLISYSLSVARAGGGPFREIATGSDVVLDAAIGRFDPTLLENDSYILRLNATDAGGNVSTTERQVNLDGQLKLGNFQLSFVDLSIPVAGIPITVSRTYDTLQADTSDDLGFGWSLGLFDTNLRTDVPPSGLEASDIYNPFRIGSKVYITNPSSGRREGFTFTAQSPSRFAVFGNVRPRFIPDPGVTSTLSVQPIDLAVTDTGEVVSFVGSLPYNPASGLFGGFYTLTSKEGIRYRVNGNTGDVETITDRNGNVLSFDEAGVTSSTGEGITFERDPKGRITAVIDPAGNRIAYEFDNNGDLVAVTDRQGNTVRYEYNASRAHYLDGVIDPLKRDLMRSEYDENGRVSKLIPTAGSPLEISYDPDGSIVETYDTIGNPATYQYDQRGNIITEIDALGNKIERIFDERDNLLLEVGPAGGANAYAYDRFGNIISQTDPTGSSRAYTYNSTNQLISASDALGNTYHYTYDANGNLLESKDPLGRAVRQTYNTQGSPITLEDAKGNIFSAAYTPKGYLSIITNPLGQETMFTYDQLGNPLSRTQILESSEGPRIIEANATYDRGGNVRKITNTEGHEISFDYNSLNEQIATTDALGRRIEAEYDRGQISQYLFADGTTNQFLFSENGRQVGAVNRKGEKTEIILNQAGQATTLVRPDDSPSNSTDNPRISFELDAAGRPTATVDELGNRSEIDYDLRGLPIAMRDANGAEIASEYDAVGRLISRTDSLGRTTRVTYDASGQVLRTIFPDGSEVMRSYDANGNIASVTNEDGHTTGFEYDPLDRLTAVIDSRTNRNEYIYNEAGHLVRQTDRNGNSTEFEYDDLGRQTAIIRPMGERFEAAYNAVGNVVRTVDFNGDIIDYEYDTNNLLVSQKLPDGSTRSFVYNESGQLQEVRDESGTTLLEYNNLYQLVARQAPDGTLIQYSYDDHGNQSSVTTRKGTTRFKYNELSQLTRVTEEGGNTTEYQYDSAGNLVAIVHGNGIREERGYNVRNLVISQKYISPDNVTLASYELTRDFSGDIRTILEFNGRRTDFDYDELNRLVKETITEPSSSVPDRVVTYTYDSVGNRLSKNDFLHGETIYSYDANDRLITETSPSGTHLYGYDSNGNRITKTINGITTSYTWNPEGSLGGVDIDGDGSIDIAYEYNYEGLRTSENRLGEVTNFYYDSTQDYPQLLLEEDEASGNLTSYTYGTERLSSESLSQQIFYLTDSHSGVRLLANESGSITDSYTYDGFGNIIEKTGGTENRFLYRGEALDSDLQQIYLRARNYDPSTGRFTSADTFSGYVEDPISLHRYLYGNSNPISFIDPSGNQSVITTIAEALTVAAVAGLVLAGGAITLGQTAAGGVINAFFGNRFIEWDGSLSFGSASLSFATGISPGAGVGVLSASSETVSGRRVDQGLWGIFGVGLFAGPLPAGASASEFNILASYGFAGPTIAPALAFFGAATFAGVTATVPIPAPIRALLQSKNPTKTLDNFEFNIFDFGFSSASILGTGFGGGVGAGLLGTTGLDIGVDIITGVSFPFWISTTQGV